MSRFRLLYFGSVSKLELESEFGVTQMMCSPANVAALCSCLAAWRLAYSSSCWLDSTLLDEIRFTWCESLEGRVRFPGLLGHSGGLLVGTGGRCLRGHAVALGGVMLPEVGSASSGVYGRDCDSGEDIISDMVETLRESKVPMRREQFNVLSISLWKECMQLSCIAGRPMDINSCYCKCA